jgi:phosphoserine phosphatase RsbU/P
MKLTQHSKQDGVILIIDHEPDQRAAVAAWLCREGYQVHIESSGLSGLEYWRKEQPAVLICDLAAPGVDGLSILKAISGAETQVIILSRAEDMDSVLAALRLGAADYLLKPIKDRTMLLHAVNRAFEEHHLIRENRLYREALEAKNRELNDSLRLLKEDQEAGRAVQLKMLPEPSKDYGNVHIEYTIIPSLYLSGDFVDYFRLGPKQIGFYLADVSGHGASSAFVTVLLKNMANRIKQRYREDFSSVKALLPADVLKRSNEELIPLGLGKHLAIFCGLIDLDEKRLVYCSAAHFPPPILVTNGKVIALEGKGLPVGLFEDVSYENQEVSIGDTFELVMFSDGILEVMPEPSVAEKERRLMEIVGKGAHNIAQLRDHLELHKHLAVPDDIAIMTVSCRAVTHPHG